MILAKLFKIKVPSSLEVRYFSGCVQIYRNSITRPTFLKNYNFLHHEVRTFKGFGHEPRKLANFETATIIGVFIATPLILIDYSP